MGGPPSRANKAGGVPPTLVTPKSHDSEALPPVAAANATKALVPKRSAAKSSGKKAMKSKKKESGSSGKLAASLSTGSNGAMEPEIQVEPMKQDFHYYAIDHYDDAMRQCRQQLDENGPPPTDKSKELFLLTTLLNARLIQNWEAAPPATRTEYLKREEADRKRFMSEEEVASRHCATLTARRRSPKQSGVGGVGRAASFGLGATVDVPSVSMAFGGGGSQKRSIGEDEADVVAKSGAKRLKAV